MTLDEIAAFVRVHQHGGVVKAAERLGRSQPAISRRLDQLEKSLGCALIERSPSTGYVGLTEAGRALLPFAQTMLSASTDARDAVREVCRIDGGEVIFAVVGTLVTSHLSTIVHRFSATSPGAKLSLITANSVEISNMVRAGQASIGMRYGEESDPLLETIPAGSEELVAVLSPELKKNMKGEGINKLSGSVWFGFPGTAQAGSFGLKLVELISDHRIPGCNIRIVDSLSAQLCLAEAGLGIALLPMAIASDALNRRSVVRVPGNLRTAIPITLIHRRGGYVSAASRALLNLAQTWRAG